MEKLNNKQIVLEFLKTGRILTAYEGFNELNMVSVRDYISMLKKDGVIIESEWRKSQSGKHYKAYWLPQPQEELYGASTNVR